MSGIRGTDSGSVSRIRGAGASVGGPGGAPPVAGRPSQPRPGDPPGPTPEPVPGRRKPGRRPRGARRLDELDEREIVAAVCHYATKGLGPTEISKAMWENHRIQMTRQLPYLILQRAAKANWLRFVPPRQDELRLKLLETYRHVVRDIEVAHTGFIEQLAPFAAEKLFQLIEEVGAGKDQVQVAFAGGFAMWSVAKELAELFRRREAESLPGAPKKIVFRALVSAAEADKFFYQPSSFFSYFTREDGFPIETSFICINGPLFVPSEDFEERRNEDCCRQACQDLDQVDIVVTSAGSWADPDNLYHKYLLEHSPESAEALKAGGIVGDMMLLPIGKDKPVDVRTPMRALTPFSVPDLQRSVARGMRVLLVLGPCGVCRKAKGDILKAILAVRDPIVTHLVVDSRTAAQVCRER